MKNSITLAQKINEEYPGISVESLQEIINGIHLFLLGIKNLRELNKRNPDKREASDYEKYLDLEIFYKPLTLTWYTLKKIDMSDWVKHVITGRILVYFKLGNLVDEVNFEINYASHSEYISYKHYLAARVENLLKIDAGRAMNKLLAFYKKYPHKYTNPLQGY